MQSFKLIDLEYTVFVVLISSCTLVFLFLLSVHVLAIISLHFFSLFTYSLFAVKHSLGNIHYLNIYFTRY